MVNEDHEPSHEEERILGIMTEGRDDGRPWGYITPKYARIRDIKSPDYHLDQLKTAGWIKRLTTGYYEYVCDPRTDDVDVDDAQDQDQDQDQENQNDTND